MNLTALIAEIDEKYPNGLSVDSKLRKADLIQKRIYRSLKRQNFVIYDIVEDQPTYPLSVDITSVFQVDVTCNDGSKYHNYPLRKVTDPTNKYTRYSYFLSDPVTGDWVGIYPTPTDKEDSIAIYYYEVPKTLDSANMSSSPMLDEKYQLLLVYGVCKEISENYRDSDIANGFTIQYNALESELLGLQRHSDVPTVRNGMGW